MLQRLAVQKFHGQKRPPAVFADVIYRADVRMVQRRCRFRLAPKTFERLRVMRHFIRQKFQRHKAVQPRVFRLVHHTHPAATQFFQDAIVRNRPANNGRGITHWCSILRPPPPPGNRAAALPRSPHTTQRPAFNLCLRSGRLQAGGFTSGHAGPSFANLKLSTPLSPSPSPRIRVSVFCDYLEQVARGGPEISGAVELCAAETSALGYGHPIKPTRFRLQTLPEFIVSKNS